MNLFPPHCVLACTAMASAEALKPKKTSAYFCFCKQHREQVKSRLKEAGQPVSAPALTKALSELWRSLSDLEKQKYKDPSPPSSDLCLDPLFPLSSGHGELEGGNRDQISTQSSPIQRCVIENAIKRCESESVSKDNGATEAGETCAQKECIDADLCREKSRVSGEEEACTEEDGLKARDEGLTENAGLAFPLARVKRIIKLDKEIRVVAADASNLIAHASQLFLEHLAIAAHNCAIKKKHKTIRIEDVKNAVKSEPRIDDFLAEAFDDVLHHDKGNHSESSDDTDDGPEVVQLDKGNANKRSKSVKKPLLEPPAGTRRIADFFANTNHLKVGNTHAA